MRRIRDNRDQKIVDMVEALYELSRRAEGAMGAVEVMDSREVAAKVLLAYIPALESQMKKIKMSCLPPITVEGMREASKSEGESVGSGSG